jgi:hypothetical protein
MEKVLELLVPLTIFLKTLQDFRILGDSLKLTVRKAAKDGLLKIKKAQNRNSHFQ